MTDFGSQKGAKKSPGCDAKLLFFGMSFLCCCGSPSRWPKRRPRGPKTPPRAPEEGSRPSKITQKEFKRTLSATQLRISVLRLEKNTIPQTIVHINVADVAEIDKDKTLLSQGAVKKRRAGGGVPPWGRQSAATRRVGACPDSFRNLLRILRTQRV